MILCPDCLQHRSRNLELELRTKALEMVVDSAQGQHQVALLEMEKLRAELEARNGVLEWKAEEDKRYKDYLLEQIGFS